MSLTPKNRKEEWLQGLVDHETTLTPKNRPEEWMKEIIDASGGGGGGGGVLIIGMTAEAGTLTLDKTWQEIYDHMSAGGQAMVFKVSTLADDPFVQQVIALSCEGFPSDSEYYVNFSDTTFPQFSATSPSGYPSASL